MAAAGVSDAPTSIYEKVHGRPPIAPKAKDTPTGVSKLIESSAASGQAFAKGQNQSVWDLLNQYETESKASADEQMGLLDTAGNQAKSDISLQSSEDLGALQASLAARGLTNTSVYDSLGARIKEGAARNKAGVDESVATGKAAYAYHPDPGLYNTAVNLVGNQPKKPNLLGQIAPIAGTVIGGAVGGPVGAGIGGAIGGAVGAYANRGSSAQGAYSGQQFGQSFGQYFAQPPARDSPYSSVGPGVTTSDLYTGYGAPAGQGNYNPYEVPGGLAVA